MNKKLLLIALPALMVMSSCAGVNHAPKEEYFKEDTELHEEFFGGLAPKRLGEPNDGPVTGDDWTKGPKVGVQFASYEKDVDPSEAVDMQTFYAVRFVAAIENTDGMTATWSRALSEKDSTQTKLMAHDKVSLAKYDSLNNNGTPAAAADEDDGNGGKFEKYVVYSMYDIPATQDESYIAAYLTLTKAGEADVVSKVVAAQVDGSHVFSFIPDEILVRNGYFLQGSRFDIIPQDDEDPAENNAVFSNLNLEATDEFGLFKFTDSCFQFFGNTTFLSSTSARFIKASSIDQYNQAYLDGEYNLYVNNINMVYTEPQSVDMDLYLVPNDNWKQDAYDHAPRFAMNAFGASDNDWFDLVETGTGTGIYKVKNDEKINLGKYTTVIFCRMNGNDDKLENNWTNKINQTKDLVINGATGPANMSQLKYSVEGWDNGDGTWSALA